MGQNRRLPAPARREQLIAAALPIVAQDGLTAFSLEQIADQVGVKRNLLYHYFPRGRQDLICAVLAKATDEITREWITDRELPLASRVQANYAQLAKHALNYDHPWRVLRMCRAAQHPDFDAIIDQSDEIMIANVSTNHLGRPDPPPLIHLALKSFIAFFESAMDQTRLTGAPPAAVEQIVSELLTAAINAASRASNMPAA